LTDPGLAGRKQKGSLIQLKSVEIVSDLNCKKEPENFD
jgi:hypothetical protein